MKYIKTLGLVAVTAVAAMAFAATASATSLTSPAGTTYTGKIIAQLQSSSLIVHNSAGEDFECKGSVAEGTVESHGVGVTAKGNISKWTLSECDATFKILKPGSIEIHATSNGNATITSSGMEIEAIGQTMTCIYTTNNTDIGLLTGSKTENARALVSSAQVPRTGGSLFCGSTGTLTGEYKITTPSTLYVD